jgi:hypothetical protein
MLTIPDSCSVYNVSTFGQDAGEGSRERMECQGQDEDIGECVAPVVSLKCIFEE